MAKVFPGGSSVTRNFPASLGPTTEAPLWTVEYELDLAALGTHDFTSTATKAITSTAAGGTRTATWTAYNSGASDKFELSSAGLEIDPKGGGQSIWQQLQSLPYLAAPLTSMMSGLSEDDTIALQLYMGSSPAPSADFDAYGLNLWNGVVPSGGTTKYLHLRYYFHTSTKYSEAFVENGTGYDALAKAAAQTFFEIVLYPGNGAASRIGVFDTEFPDPLTTGDLDSFASLSGALGPGGGGGTALPSWSIPKATASFMIHAQRQSSATALTTTAYKMRVLRRRKD